MKIGGGPRRPYRTPNTSNISDRVNNTIRNLAYSHNNKMAVAVGIDAPDCYLFSKEDGAVWCTCSRERKSPRRFSAMPAGGEIYDQSDDDFIIHDPSTDMNAGLFNTRDQSPLPSGVLDDSEEPFDNDALAIGGELDYSDVNIDSGILSQLQAVQPGGHGDIVKCYVCIGASKVDAWKLFKGTRIVYHFTENDIYRHDDDSVVRFDAAPNQIELSPGGYVEWDIALPKVFQKVLRVQIWNNDKAVKNVMAYIYKKSAPDVKYPATVRDVESLNGQFGKDWALRVVADPDAVVNLTHVEFQFAFNDPEKGQLPPIEVPYDHDYYDYNLTSTFEFSAETDIKTGGLIAEDKHGRLWRVTSVNRKTLADGTAIGLQVDVRVVQPKEVYYLLNPFLQKDTQYILHTVRDATIEYKGAR